MLLAKVTYNLRLVSAQHYLRRSPKELFLYGIVFLFENQFRALIVLLTILATFL
jgi:hypothetical protein